MLNRDLISAKKGRISSALVVGIYVRWGRGDLFTCDLITTLDEHPLEHYTVALFPVQFPVQSV